jgi:predicted nucleic acid-binding protein
MVDYPSSCVVDTSLIIDLYVSKIITHLFKLPYNFIAPDVIIAELHEPGGPLLIKLGLKQGELEGDQIIEILRLRTEYNRPSVNDLFALVLARTLKAILLTNDRSLRKAAEQQGVVTHGTLWVLDEMVRLEIISPSQAADALRTMFEKGSRLPLDECNKRLQKWLSSS